VTVKRLVEIVVFGPIIALAIVAFSAGMSAGYQLMGWFIVPYTIWFSIAFVYFLSAQDKGRGGG
jgi:hypothetical protein